MRPRCAIGMDLGGTKISAGLVDADGTLLRRLRMPTPAAGGPVAVFAAMRFLIGQLLTQADRLEISGIGLGIPGLIDRSRGLSVQSPNLGWSQVPVLTEFSGFGLPVEMENDVRCHALGELAFGAGKGLRNFVLLTLGTGIGSGVILDGRLFQGSSGMPGEIGHVVVQPDGPLCGCGNHGCLEALAGGAALGRRLREAGVAENAADLVRRAEAGDPQAAEVLDDVCRHLGWGVSIMANLFNPQRVIIGGGMAQGGEALFARLRPYACKFTMPGLRATYDIVPAGLHEEAGVIGAAALVGWSSL